jgi:hypothetical protein
MKDDMDDNHYHVRDAWELHVLEDMESSEYAILWRLGSKHDMDK